MATHHNFRIKNGLEVGGVLIVNSSGQLQAASISGAISATSIGVTNIVTNKVVKFNGSILDDSNITDTGSLITLGSNTTVSGKITTSGTGTAGLPTLDIINSSSSTFNHSIEAMTPNMTAAESNIIVFGRAGSTKNSGYIGYKYSSAGSNNNVITLGHWGSDHLVTIDGVGNMTSSGAITSAGLTVNGGSTNVVANFISTDGTAAIKLQDNSGNVELSAAGSTFQVQPSGGAYKFKVDSSGNTTAIGYLEHYSYLYSRQSLRVLNAAGNGWHNWATRGGGKFDLNVNNIVASGTLSSGAITATTVDTGQGATEVHLMNQNVRTSDSPTFQDLTVQGNLSITGDINSYNVTDLDVTDKTITVGAGQTEANSGGSGLIVDGSGAQMLWDEGDNRFEFNKNVYTTGQWQGNGSGLNTLNASNISSGTLASARLPGHIDVGGQIDIGVSSNYGTTTSPDRLWSSSFSTGQSDVPGNYYDILNLSTSAAHGIQIASHYGAAQTAVYIRTRSDNASAPSGAGLQPWALIWTARTDGSGSGLDADLLDGQQGSYYLAYGNLTGSPTIPTIPSNNVVEGGTSYSGEYPMVARTSANTIYSHNGIKFNGAQDKLTVAGSVVINGGTSWHSGNDGSGSGLDADLLDGQHGSYYYSSANPPPTYSKYLRSDIDDTVTAGVTYTFPASDSPAIISTRGTGGASLYVGGWSTGTNSSNIHRISSSSNLHIDSASNGHLYLNYYSGGTTYIGGANVAWHAGNDGSGSGLDADLLDGQHGSYYTNPTSLPANGGNADTVDNMHFHNQLGVGEKIDFSVGGDAATYYPVVITGGGGERVTDFQIFRSYGETAPSSWGSSTHMGGLTFNYKIMGSAGWGGYPTGIRVQEFGEIYRRILGGIAFTAHTMKHVVWLRGGTATYHIWSNADISIEVNDSTSAANYVSASPHKWYSYDHSNAAYDVTVSERTSAQADSGVANEVYLNMPVSYNSAGTPAVYGIATSAYTHKFWNSSNDGSGSGLDADLLDGQHGSYYATASGLTSTTTTANAALPKAGGTMTGNLNLSGSGNHILIGGTATNNHYNSVSATTGLTFGGGNDFSNYSIGTSTQNIDGNYTKLNIKWHTGIRFFAMNRYGGVRFHSDVGMGTEIFSIGNTDGHVRAANNLYANGGNLVWNASNDGSGSGLDADTLDGIQGASFLRSDAADTATAVVSLRAGGNHLGNHEFAASSTGTSYSTAAIELRESNYTGTSSATPPQIGFHWGGVVASNISMDSAGAILIRNNPGNAYENFRANNIYANGTNLVWHVGNDGAGSGLDADLLDGQQGSYYRPASQATTLTGAVTGSGTTSISTSNPYQTSVTFQGSNGNSPDSSMEYQQLSSITDTKISPTGDWHNSIRMGHGDPYNYYSNTLALQMTGTLTGTLRTQTISNNTAQGWRTIWDTANDGSGSGLDADLLDGQHGSYYGAAADSVLKNANTMTGSAFKMGFHSGSGGTTFGANHYSMGVDVANGSWSGTHYSDLIIGYHTGIRIGAAYSGTRFYSNSPTTDTDNDGEGQGTETLLMTVGGHLTGGSGVAVGGTLSAANLKVGTWSSNNQVWHAGNDGSGSTLDADLLDGQHASAFQAAGSYLTAETLSSTNAVTVTGTKYFQPAGTATSPLGGGGGASLQAYTTGTTAAYMAFHRSGAYAINWGLDTSNTMVLGGWSSSTTAARMSIGTNGLMVTAGQGNLWGAGNDGSGSGLDADLLDGYNAEEGAVNNSIVKRDGTASIKAHGLSLMRVSTATTGISWYNEAYYNWQDYMAAAGATSCGPNGNLTAPTGLAGVTSWALRSRMEGVSSYGWNWETGTGGGGAATATSKMSLNATTGNLALVGTCSASGFYDQNSSGFYVDPASSTNLQSTTSTPALKVTQTVGGGNNIGSLFQNATGNFAWGCIAEYRINGTTGTDKPSIIFSHANNTETYTVGFGYTDSNFRIKKDHGHRNGGWGTSLMTMDRSGNVTFAGNVTAYSDERLKTEIKTIENPLDTISKLRGVTFKWKESGDDSMGVIAQEVEAIAETKCLVSETPEDGNGDINPKNVAYGNMVGLLIEGMKEQQGIINRLEQDIKNLKDKIK